MKTTRSNSMPPAPRSAPSSATTPTQTLQRSPSAPDLGATAKTPTTPKSPTDNSSFNAQPKASGSHVPQNTSPTTRPQSAPSSPTSGGQPKTVSSSLDAEMARNKEKLGGSPRSGGPAPSPHHGEVVSGLNERIAQGNQKNAALGKPGDFNPNQYSKQELQELTSHANALKIPPRDTEALLFAGSRKEKPINAAEMKQQMDNHVNVINQRGYPYRFESKEQYQQFSNSMINGLQKQGFPTDQVMIQGSALRKPTAGDVDISVLANKQQFAQALTNNYSPDTPGKKGGTVQTNKVKENGQGVDLRGMSYAQMQDLSGKIKADKDASVAAKEAGQPYTRIYNSTADSFQYAVDNGKMASKGEQNKPMKPVALDIQKNYPDANVESVSLVLQGSAFDTPPNMQVKKS